MELNTAVELFIAHVPGRLKLYSQMLGKPENLLGTNTLAKFCLTVNDEGKMSCNTEARTQCYKAFYGRNLRMLIISQSVWPWHSFPA
jgi:hypothetical protein